MALALTVLALHVAQVWGYSSIFRGDMGRWLYEVEQMASGRLPYRDFQWNYPPLGLWVEGGLAHLLGTNRAPVAVITTALTVLIVLAFVPYVRHVLGRSDGVLVTLCLVLAFAFAQTNGAPLPLGLYSPAALVGAVCIAFALFVFARSLTRPRPRDALWIGLASGLAVLSKQDFWIPAAVLVAIVTARRKTLIPVVGSGLVVTLGMAVVVATAGFGIVLPLVGGFGHVQLAGGLGFPSWERLVVDVFTVSLITGTLAVLASVAFRRILVAPLAVSAVLGLVMGGIYVFMTMHVVPPAGGELRSALQSMVAMHLANGDSLLRPAVGWLRMRVGETPIPVLLPPCLLAIVGIRWRHLPSPRRTTIALLLVVATALRARRAFEATEWFEFLFTIPIVFATLEVLLSGWPSEWRRLRIYVLAAMIPLAVWATRIHGRGWGTWQYWPATTTTLRGDFHWSATEAREYRKTLATVDSIDPRREHPLFGFGFSGAWNYFLRRHNPYPFTQGFYFSAVDADSVLAGPRPGGLILIDNPLLDASSWPARKIDWRRWEQARVPTPYGTYDRTRFARLREGCARVPVDSTVFTVYSCP